MKLTEEQAEQIRQLFKTHPDIKRLTQIVFKDDTLDGRTRQGRLVRDFLIKEGLEYKTTMIEKVPDIDLTDEQRDFIKSDQADGMKPIEITRVLFNNKDVEPLSIEHRTILEYLRKFRPDLLEDDDMVVSEKWKPPMHLSQSIKKVNQWVGKSLTQDRITTKDKKCCEQLLIHLKSPRFESCINAYKLVSDRDLFESEFVRSVWDKPDLTIDELNLYVTVCSNYVRQKHIQKRLDKLNNKLTEMEDVAEDVNMRFNELIKNTSDELNACEKRIEALIQKLNGDRAKRLEQQGRDSVSIIALVEAFQEHEERERLVKMAEMENVLAEQEVDRLESMDDIKARILGINKRELL